MDLARGREPGGAAGVHLAGGPHLRQDAGAERAPPPPPMSLRSPRPVQQLGDAAGACPTTYGTHSLKACCAVSQASWSRAAAAAMIAGDAYRAGAIGVACLHAEMLRSRRRGCDEHRA